MLQKLSISGLLDLRSRPDSGEICFVDRCVWIAKTPLNRHAIRGGNVIGVRGAALIRQANNISPIYKLQPVIFGRGSLVDAIPQTFVPS